MSFDTVVRSQHVDLELEEVLGLDPSALSGVTDAAKAALGRMGIGTVFDLCHSRIFGNARKLCSQDEGDALFRFGRIPADMIDAESLSGGVDTAWKAPVSVLEGIDSDLATLLREAMAVETVYDLANWPPYVALRRALDMDQDQRDRFHDPEIPRELVPSFNEFPTEKQFYSVYLIDDDATPVSALKPLDGPLDLGTLNVAATALGVRTGYILRFEQSWTARGLALGNLLHSMTLAPGESTRIAMVDWSRRQGVRTTEDISQLEALSNSLMQARSISEVTSAVAREAQSGFSKMDANSTVSNTAYSSFGLQNPEQTLAAMGVGGLVGGVGGAAAGGVAGAGIGAVAGASLGVAAWGIGAVPGALVGAAAGAGIGMGTGGLIGTTAGAAAAGLATANFGANSQNGSNTQIDAVTTTSSTGTRDIAAQMAQNIQDRTQQHSSSSRNRKAAIVQEVRQEEREQITSRVITNYNHMHALTMNYFEVVQIYAVKVRARELTPCLYVPFKSVKWTSQLAERFKPVLLANALTLDFAMELAWPAELSLLRNLTESGFSDAERKRHLGSTVAENAALREAIQRAGGLPGAGPADPFFLPAGAELVRIDGGPADARYSFEMRDGRKVPSTVTGEGPEEEVVEVTLAFRKRRAKTRGIDSGPSYSEHGESIQLTLEAEDGSIRLGGAYGFDVPIKVNFDANTVTIPREVLYSNYTSVMVFAAQLPDLTVPVTVKRRTRKNPAVSFASQRIGDIARIVMHAEFAGAAGSRGIPAEVRGRLANQALRIAFTVLWNGTEYRLNLPFKLREDRVHQIPRRRTWVEFDLLALDHAALQDSLLDHLNQNTDWYTQRVYQTLGDLEYANLVGQFKWQGKPLLNQVDIKPVAISGNYLVFKSKHADQAAIEAWKKANWLDHDSIEIIPLGTGGVFGEAVMGRANSAERLDITRFWNWQDSPIPIVPPEIAPLQAGSRYQASDVRPANLDAALVANMAPQALPAPEGLGRALQVLGSADLFRDMSGIAHTAGLAQKALEEAMEGATTTGDQNAENLRKGLDFTKEIAGKIMDMTSQYANKLADAGFGALTAAAGGKPGIPAQTPPRSATGSEESFSAPEMVGAGEGGTAGKNLGNSNPTVAGALWNQGEKMDAAAASQPSGDGEASSSPRTIAESADGDTSRGKSRAVGEMATAVMDNAIGVKPARREKATSTARIRNKAILTKVNLFLRGQKTGPISGWFMLRVSGDPSGITTSHKVRIDSGFNSEPLYIWMLPLNVYHLSIHGTLDRVDTNDKTIKFIKETDGTSEFIDLSREITQQPAIGEISLLRQRTPARFSELLLDANILEDVRPGTIQVKNVVNKSGKVSAKIAGMNATGEILKKIISYGIVALADITPEVSLGDSEEESFTLNMSYYVLTGSAEVKETFINN